MTDSPVAFRQIYDEHFAYVWKLVQRYGVPLRHVEDVVHEVFMVVHRRLPEFEQGRAMKPWLAGIAFRTASDFIRRAPQRREVFLEEELDELMAHSNPESEAQERQAMRLVHRAVGMLEETRRQVLILHEFEGMSIPDVAVACGIPLNTAYSRLRLARQDFAQAVTGIGGAP